MNRKQSIQAEEIQKAIALWEARKKRKTTDEDQLQGLAELVATCTKQAETIDRILEQLEEMSEQISTLNMNLRSLTGRRNDREKKDSELFRDERIAIIKHNLLFGGRFSFKKKKG